MKYNKSNFFVGFVSIILTITSVGCQDILKNKLPKKELSSSELVEASNALCKEGKTLKEFKEKLSTGKMATFYNIPSSETLFYFDKGNSKCALESNYEERPVIPLPPFYDFHTITTISFTNNCLPNNVLFKVIKRDHFDSVINELTLEALFENDENKDFVVHFRTHDDKTLYSLNEATGLKILTCEESTF